MAKQVNLMKAVDAIINNEPAQAEEFFRTFFVESAREINAQLDERFGGDMEDDFYDEVGVDLEDDVQEEEAEPEEDFSEFDIDGEEEAAPEGEFGEEEAQEDAPKGGVPTEEEWARFEDAFEELEALFNDTKAAAPDSANESYTLKTVKTPKMQETDADNTKPVLAKPQGTGPTGVKAATGWTKDGTVSGSSVKTEKPAGVSPKAEKDHTNKGLTTKNMYKTAKMPPQKETDVDNTTAIIKPYKK